MNADWLPEEDEMLKALWEHTANSAAWIAAAFNDYRSRFAIIGRAHRLKLTPRRKGFKMKKPKPKVTQPRIRRTKAACHISELTNARCHDVLEPINEFMYCGLPTVDGTWCKKHRALYYQKPYDRRRDLK